MRNVTCLWNGLRKHILLACILAMCTACSEDSSKPNITSNEQPAQNISANITSNEQPAQNVEGNRKLIELLKKSQHEYYSQRTKLPENMGKTYGPIIIKKYEKLLIFNIMNVTKYVKDYHTEFNGLDDYNNQLVKDFVESVNHELSKRNTTMTDLLTYISDQVRQFYHLIVSNVSKMLKGIDEGIKNSIIRTVERIDNYTKTCNKEVKDTIKYYGNATADEVAKSCAANIKSFARNCTGQIAQLSGKSNSLLTGLIKQASKSFKEMASNSAVNLNTLVKSSPVKEDNHLANSSVKDLNFFANETAYQLKNLSTSITEHINSLKNQTADVLKVLAEVKGNMVKNVTGFKPGSGFTLSSGNLNIDNLKLSVETFYNVHHVLPKESFDEINDLIKTTNYTRQGPKNVTTVKESKHNLTDTSTKHP